MKQYTTRQLQLTQEWLNELPIEVIKYGKVVCTLYSSKDEMVSEYEEKLEIAREEYRKNKKRIKELEEYIKQANKETIRLKKINEFSEEIKPKNSLDSMNPAMENSFGKDKYVPQACQFYRRCPNPSVGLHFLGQWTNGIWKEVGEKHLCQEHINFVEKDKESVI